MSREESTMLWMFWVLWTLSEKTKATLSIIMTTNISTSNLNSHQLKYLLCNKKSNEISWEISSCRLRRWKPRSKTSRSTCSSQSSSRLLSKSWWREIGKQNSAHQVLTRCIKESLSPNRALPCQPTTSSTINSSSTSKMLWTPRVNSVMPPAVQPTLWQTSSSFPFCCWSSRMRAT